MAGTRSVWVLPLVLAALLYGGRAVHALTGKLFGCDAYVPTAAECPDDEIVMEGNTADVMPGEAEWVSAREGITASAWEVYLGSLGLQGLNLTDIMARAPPRMAFAASGGGLRATLNSAGVSSSFDAREAKAAQAMTGGIMQMMTYYAGISGGSWTTGSLFHNDFQPVSDWWPTLNIEDSLLFPGGNRAAQVAHLASAKTCVEAKQAGWTELSPDKNETIISIADVYGRSLAVSLLDNSAGSVLPSQESPGEGFTMSQFIDDATNPVATGSAPMPIIVAGMFSSGSEAATNSSWGDMLVPWETSPLWAGSYHPRVASFVQTKYMGSPSGGCSGDAETPVAYANFDNLGWLMAGSGLYIGSGVDWESEAQVKLLHKFSAVFPTSFSFGIENPFGAPTDLLHLTDAGLGDFGQTPLLPFLLPSRGVEIIFAVDNSGDFNGYPNGTDIIKILDYARDVLQYPTPSVPDTPEEFVEGGLTETVTFFGCGESGVPTIVYIPNQEVKFPSNVSTFKFSYTEEELTGMLDNGHNSVAANPNALDLPLALGCLLASKRGHTSEECSNLLSTYCWMSPIGGQQDENGCLSSAGYSWCAQLQQCIREWETPCVGTTNGADSAGHSSWRLPHSSLLLPPLLMVAAAVLH